MAIAEGIIIGWPDTAASIPSGWSRVTALDGMYLRAISTDETEPGGTGGSSAHSHTTPGHVHDMSHGHAPHSAGVVTAESSTARGEESSKDLSGTHSHSFSLSDSTLSSGSATPGTDSISNNLDRLEVIWIESDGTPEEFPEGALVFSTGAVIGFAASEIVDLFLRGASPTADGGSTVPGTLDNHVHAIAAHTHTGAGSHAHPAGTSSQSGNAKAINTDSSGGPYTPPHYHSFTVSSASTGDPDAAGGGTSGPAEALPPFSRLLVLESEGDGPETGIIIPWLGSLDEIPEDWFLCNGENETPNLCHGRFILATDTPEDVLSAGGTETHTHTAPAPHTHTIGTHSHLVSFEFVSGVSGGAGTAQEPCTAPHGSEHNGSSANASNYIGSSSVGTISEESHIPEYTEVAFLMYRQEGIFFNVTSPGVLLLEAPGGRGASVEMEIWTVRLEPAPQGEAEVYDS